MGLFGLDSAPPSGNQTGVKTPENIPVPEMPVSPEKLVGEKPSSEPVAQTTTSTDSIPAMENQPQIMTLAHNEPQESLGDAGLSDASPIEAEDHPLPSIESVQTPSDESALNYDHTKIVREALGGTKSPDDLANLDGEVIVRKIEAGLGNALQDYEAKKAKLEKIRDPKYKEAYTDGIQDFANAFGILQGGTQKKAA